MTQQMKAVFIEAYGDNDVVRYADVGRPKPLAGEILVKVHAAGVNPVDWKVRDGAGQRMGMTLPIHLGSEVSGTVAELGENVTKFECGDAIFGSVKLGGFAEYVTARASDMVRKPERLDFINAAAVPLGALTAWQGMFDAGKLEGGQKVLITGTSGGVGSMAVQLAKSRGVNVTGMASGRNAAFVRELGVDDFIDYEKHAFENTVKGMDVVFDTVGGDVFNKAFATLKKEGILVTCVAFPKNEAQKYDVGVQRVVCKPDAKELAAIRDLVDASKLKPHVSRVLPLAEVRQALDLSKAGRTRGKIVLQMV